MRDGWLWSPWWAHGILVLVALGTVAALHFVWAYQRNVGWTWWRHNDGEANLTGRWLMVWALSRVLVLGLTLVNWAAGPWPGILPVSFVVMGIFCLHTFVPYRLLVKAQEGRDATQKERDHEHVQQRPDDSRPEPGRVPVPDAGE